MAVIVRGYRGLQATFKAAGPQAKRELNKELRHVAEPVRSDAEVYVAAGIRNIGPKWSRMRVGVTTRLVYVAPRQRGVARKGDVRRRRPNLADLMAPKMEQALQRNQGRIEGAADDMLGRLTHEWNRG
jgi:hypothetical protein